MKQLTHTPRLNKLEFWLATAVFTLMLLDLLMEFRLPDTMFGWANYLKDVVRYTSIYLTFLLFNFLTVPRLLRGESIIQGVVTIASAWILIALFYQRPEVPSVGFLMFAGYTVARYGLIYLWSISGKVYSRFKFIAPGVLPAFAFYLISIFFMVAADAEPEVLGVWTAMVPFAIILYSYAFFRIIPSVWHSTRRRRRYVLRMMLFIAAATPPLMLLTLFIVRNEDAPFIIGFSNIPFQLFITTPLAWIMYRRHKKGSEELQSLKKELGQSEASLDFLRSQINPHFLFNALNTLYGTALQEKAERTSEGIQKLGDMMRFMLQENVQENISLSREVEYLHNYISFQKLRTATLPTLNIHTSIAEDFTPVQVAPMLLIPFVENAFKHGISFREPSYINIALEIKDNALQFDVSNSNHRKSQHDPEKNSNGIGLANVRQRLQLLYPYRHALTVRETGKDFFIHLTIQLS